MSADQNIGLRISELVSYFANGVNTRFADLIGTSEANIRNYRNGKMPKYDFIFNVCTILEINYEWLITGNGQMLRGNKKNIDVEKKVSIPDTPYSNIEEKYPVVSEPDVKCTSVPFQNALVESLIHENNTLQVRTAVLESENKGLQNENRNLQKTIEDKQDFCQQIIENKQAEIDRCLSEMEKKQSIIESFISGRITTGPRSGSNGSKATG